MGGASSESEQPEIFCRARRRPPGSSPKKEPKEPGTHGCRSAGFRGNARRAEDIVSFPADFSPSVGKSTSGKLPIAFRFAVFQSLLASRIHCLRHVVHCTLTAMQSYVTSHVKLK